MMDHFVIFRIIIGKNLQAFSFLTYVVIVIESSKLGHTKKFDYVVVLNINFKENEECYVRVIKNKSWGSALNIYL